MSFQRRASAFDLGRRMDARFMATAQAGGAPLTLPTANLIAAYDARSFVSLDGGVTASTWTDISGNGWHGTQGTAGDRALIGTSDGDASLLFDGITDHYVTAITSAAGPLTLYTVTKCPAPPATYMAMFDSNNGGGGRLLAGRMATRNYGIYDGVPRDSGIVAGTGRERLVFEAAVIGASRVWRNGVAGAVAGLSSLKALGSSPKIGREAVSAYSHFNGHFFSLQIYGAAINNNVEAFNMQEYGA